MYFSGESYLKHQPFMAYLVWYSKNMEVALEEEKNTSVY